jgi:hypothetical protein
MTTVTAFNTMLKSFLEELTEVFPEQRDVATFLAGFDAFTTITPRKPLQLFVDAIAPHVDMLMTKDAGLFAALQFPGIDFNAMWTSPGVTDATRDAIWQYLHTLFLLGTTVQSLPPELLASIETVAHDCAEKMQGGEMDFSSMASALMGGLGPLANLAGGAGALPGALPAAPRRKKSSK